MDEQIPEVSYYYDYLGNPPSVELPSLGVASSGILNFGQVFVFLSAFIAVVILAVYVTRMVAGQRFKFAGKNIRIIESVGMGQTSNISIIKVGSKYLLVGATKENISLLSPLDENDLDMSHINTEPLAFSKYLDRFLSKKGEEEQEEDEKIN